PPNVIANHGLMFAPTEASSWNTLRSPATPTPVAARTSPVSVGPGSAGGPKPCGTAAQPATKSAASRITRALAVPTGETAEARRNSALALGDHRRDLLLQIGEVEGFVDVLVGAVQRRGQLVDVLANRRQHHDPDLFEHRILTQRTRNFPAVHLGHHDVEDDQVGPLGAAPLHPPAPLTPL